MAIIRKDKQHHQDEPLDRNKTKLTHFVTACAIGYLANRGFHPIETEVSTTNGIVDIASFCYPSPTESKLLKLRVPRINIESQYKEIQFKYGHLLTAVIEVKTNRGDFKKDLNTKFSGRIFPAHLCYLAFPKGIIESNEYPRGWICLEVYPSTRTITRNYNYGVNVHPQHPGDVADLCAHIAIRREYRTRFTALRTWLKMYRAENSK